MAGGDEWWASWKRIEALKVQYRDVAGENGASGLMPMRRFVSEPLQEQQPGPDRQQSFMSGAYGVTAGRRRVPRWLSSLIFQFTDGTPMHPSVPEVFCYTLQFPKGHQHVDHHSP